MRRSSKNSVWNVQLTPHGRGVIMRRFFQDTRGANLVEYIILVGVVALLSIAAFKFYENKMRGKVVEQAKTVGTINAGTGN